MTRPTPATAERPVGASGVRNGVAVTTAPTAPTPVAVRAEIRNRTAVPPVSPTAVWLVAVEAVSATRSDQVMPSIERSIR